MKRDAPHDLPLKGRRILIFVGPDYEDMELQYPKYRLIEAGASVQVAGPEPHTEYLGKHGYPQHGDAAIDQLKSHDFDGVVIPGGWMPDKLRRLESVKRLVREMHEAGKMIASICHGPWIDISAGVVEGFRYTSSPGIKDDLINAGAQWVDEPVVIDRNHVSSRRPDDLPAFAQGMLKVMRGVGQVA